MEHNAACLTDVGRVRDHNEDCVGAEPAIGLWVVADGLGGHEAGEVASGLAVSNIVRMVAEGVPVVDAIRQTHLLIRDAPSQGIGSPGMGTTVVVAQVVDGHFRVCWVGDSRAYLYGRGGLRQISVDHTHVQDLLDGGLISAEEAEVHPQRNVITQCLGSVQHADVQVGEVTGQIEEDDLLLLCSDGLTGEVPDQHVAAILAHEAPIEDRAQLLVHQAKENGGSDNITVALIPAGAGVSLGAGRGGTGKLRSIGPVRSRPRAKLRVRAPGLVAAALAAGVVGVLLVGVGGFVLGRTLQQEGEDTAGPRRGAEEVTSESRTGSGQEQEQPGQPAPRGVGGADGPPSGALKTTVRRSGANPGGSDQSRIGDDSQATVADDDRSEVQREPLEEQRVDAGRGGPPENQGGPDWLPQGSLRLEIKPADATVVLEAEDRQLLDGAHLPVGTHRLRIGRDGYREVAYAVLVTEGDVAPVRVTLEPMTTEPVEVVDDPQGGPPRVASAATPGGFTDPLKKSGGHGPEMVEVVPSGPFRMDCSNDEDNCQETGLSVGGVQLRPFAIAKHKVVEGSYQRFVGAKDHRHKGKCDTGNSTLRRRKKAIQPQTEPDRRKAICVSWEDVTKYAEWLSDETGERYRIPSEAEWEYVVRTNGLGVEDLVGSVWEWTADCYRKNFSGIPTDGGPVETDSEGRPCVYRVLRRFSGPSVGKRNDQSELRRSWREEYPHYNIGFRIVRELTDAQVAELNGTAQQ